MNTKTNYRKCWEEKHDCAFNEKGYCTLLNFTKFNLGCSFYKKNTEYDKKAVEKACKKYNPGKYEGVFKIKEEPKKSNIQYIYPKTVLGNDKIANSLLDTLLEKKFTCISVNRYKSLIKKYKSKKKFLEALLEKHGVRCDLRFIEPQKADNMELAHALNTFISEDDKGFYILEEAL